MPIITDFENIWKLLIEYINKGPRPAERIINVCPYIPSSFYARLSKDLGCVFDMNREESHEEGCPYCDTL